MKKLLIIPLIAMPLVACNAEQENATPLQILATAIQSHDTVELSSPDGDDTKYYQVSATDELLEIYNGEKTVAFNVGEHAFNNTTDKCVINVWSETDYRLFCGTKEDVTAEHPWAVYINE